MLWKGWPSFIDGSGPDSLEAGSSDSKATDCFFWAGFPPGRCLMGLGRWVFLLHPLQGWEASWSSEYGETQTASKSVLSPSVATVDPPGYSLALWISDLENKMGLILKNWWEKAFLLFWSCFALIRRLEKTQKSVAASFPSAYGEGAVGEPRGWRI